MTIEIQATTHAACDACHRRHVYIVMVTIGGTAEDPGVLDSFILCHQCRKTLASMLLDRTTWIRSKSLKAGEIALA